MNKEYQVQYSQCKTKLWVNCSTGDNVARYDIRFGMDIHTTTEEQLQGKPSCLLCTHGKSDQAEFDLFCSKVKELWNVDIDKTQIQFIR